MEEGKRECGTHPVALHGFWIPTYYLLGELERVEKEGERENEENEAKLHGFLMHPL